MGLNYLNFKGTNKSAAKNVNFTIVLPRDERSVTHHAEKLPNLGIEVYFCFQKHFINTVLEDSENEMPEKLKMESQLGPTAVNCLLKP